MARLGGSLLSSTSSNKTDVLVLVVRIVWWLMVQTSVQRVMGSNPGVGLYYDLQDVFTYIYVYHKIPTLHSCWVAERLMPLTLVWEFEVQTPVRVCR